ncbi:MAG: hypothetical protein ACYSWU_22915, partial [Planctomycetota bacterium]
MVDNWLRVLLGGIVLAADSGAARPAFRVADLVPLGDKVAHFLLVGIMSLLLNLTLSGTRVRLAPVRLLKGNLILVCVVTLEELSQLLLL